VGKLAVIGVLILLSLQGEVFAQRRTSLWHVRKSKHFIIYYKEASSSYINELIRRAENYYNTITRELGFSRYHGFWTWDDRAKIYLFKDRSEYQKETGQPEWSAAHVNVIKKEIYAYPQMENFFEVVLPHEMAHIIFREFVGYKKQLPLWLDEGIASMFEPDKRLPRLKAARALIRTKFFMDLEDLNIAGKGSIIMPDVFYALSASIIEFLLDSYSEDHFIRFCRSLRDLRQDQHWSRALFSVYGFNSMDEMNDAWQAFLRE
jgi:hypothetical protein